MSDCEGHGHKAVVYKSHFPPLRHSVVQRHQQIHWLINHVYSKDPSLSSLCPHDTYQIVFYEQVVPWTFQVVQQRGILDHHFLNLRNIYKLLTMAKIAAQSSVGLPEIWYFHALNITLQLSHVSLHRVESFSKAGRSIRYSQVGRKRRSEELQKTKLIVRHSVNSTNISSQNSKSSNGLLGWVVVFLRQSRLKFLKD